MPPLDYLFAVATLAAIFVFLFWRFLRSTSTSVDLGVLGTAGGGQLIPESLYTIVVSDESVFYEHPDGTKETILWSQLRRVELVTTDEGPFLPDSFWVLVDDQTQCTIAQGAKGEDALLERLQSLPGFDNDQVILAMGSISNARFLCWDSDGPQS